MRASTRFIVAALVTVLVARSARALPVADFSAALRLDAAYDSNVFNGRGPDFVTRISPRVALDVHDLRLDVKLGYDLGLWFYALAKASNSVNQHGLASIDYRVTRRLDLHVGDEIIYAHDPGFLYRAGVVAPQTSIFDNTLDVLARYRISRRVAVNLVYSFRRTLFGAPPPGSPPLFNGDEHDGVVGLALQAGRVDELRVAHRVQYFTADDAGLAVTHSPAVAWRHRFLRALELKIEAGPIAYQQLDTAIVSVVGMGATGWTWRGLGMLQLVTPHLRASVSLVRDLVGGTGAASVLWADYVYGQVIGTIGRVGGPLGGPLGGPADAGSIELRGGVGGFANGLAPNESRLYDGMSVDAAVDWRMVPEVSLGAYYSFRWQEANMPGDAVAPLPSITRHIVGVRLQGVIGAEARRHPKPGAP